MGGFHGGGMSAPRGGGMAMSGRGYGGRQSAMNGNLRSNSGGLRRGSTRASYVHGLNNQRSRLATPPRPPTRAAVPPPRPPLAGGAPPRPPIPGGRTAAAAPRPPIGGPAGAPPPPAPGPSGSAIPPSGIAGSSQTPNR
jgi:hypothetical protein